MIPALVEIPCEVEQTAEESLDELQTLNTGLCFLCSINADATEVASFLRAHPQALLLEGAAHLQEESARAIVHEQMRRCECFSPACHQNRLKVLQHLDRGFLYYQSRQRTRQQNAWGMYADKLIGLEHDIRKLRMEELLMRNRLVETAVEVRGFRDELDQYAKYQTSGLALLACTRNHELVQRKSVLEYQVGVASLNLSSVEREHKTLLKEIRERRKTQFVLLKTAFDGVRRHVCVSNGLKDNYS